MSRKHRPSAPVKIRAGRIEFLRVNAERWSWRDTYHWILTLNWIAFVAFLVGIYLAVNTLFALLYLAGGACIADMPSGSFSAAFFFSVETLATVGYGHMYPNTLYGHFVTTAEIMTGMFGLALMTGLMFVRFSRPMARIVFSRTLVIAPFDGRPTLMLRVANLRDHSMAEAEFRLMLLRDEPVAEGENVRRFHPLRVHPERVIMFPAALTIRHTLDEHSPLHGATLEDLQRGDVRFMASIVCVDTVIPASVQSQQDYTWEDVRFNERFVEIYTGGLNNNRMTVDYGLLHETEPVPGS